MNIEPSHKRGCIYLLTSILTFQTYHTYPGIGFEKRPRLAPPAGTLSLLWCVLWFWLVSDRPHLSSRISAAELDHITSSLAAEKRPCVGPTPWKAIFTSAPVWAVSAAHTASNWGNYQLVSDV